MTVKLNKLLLWISNEFKIFDEAFVDTSKSRNFIFIDWAILEQQIDMTSNSSWNFGNTSERAFLNQIKDYIFDPDHTMRNMVSWEIKSAYF